MIVPLTLFFTDRSFTLKSGAVVKINFSEESTRAIPSPDLFNISRNFSFIGIIAIGMTFVIITAGIDLSVGSIMGLTGVICGLFLDAQYLPEWYSKAGYFSA